MKKILLLIILICCVPLSATEQIPDIFFYNGTKMELSIGWGHPSPLETYFLQSETASPFSMISTANYRGFQASWTIVNDSLILTNVSSYSSPDQLFIEPKTTEQGVIADWFSGVIECYGKDANSDYVQYLFHFSKGKLIQMARVSKADYDAMEKYKGFTAIFLPQDTQHKKKLLKLNHQYIAYYFRMWNKDHVSYKNQSGLFSRGNELSPLFQFYNDDHMLWPYNWENQKQYGAPNCEWEITEEKLYLKKVSLLYGTNFNHADTAPIELETLFPNADEYIFADWVNGIFLITFGEEISDNYYSNFHATGYIIMSINDGVIKESYELPGEFDFKTLPQDLNPNITNLLELY